MVSDAVCLCGKQVRHNLVLNSKSVDAVRSDVITNQSERLFAPWQETGRVVSTGHWV